MFNVARTYTPGFFRTTQTLRKSFSTLWMKRPSLNPNKNEGEMFALSTEKPSVGNCVALSEAIQTTFNLTGSHQLGSEEAIKVYWAYIQAAQMEALKSQADMDDAITTPAITSSRG